MPRPSPSGTPLPYPAYGTPAPGVSTQKPVAGVPTSISLQQAIQVAAAKSPALLSAVAVLEQAHAPLSLARTGIFPNISGTGITSHTNLGGNRLSAGGSNVQIGGSSTSNSLTADLRQLIYDGGRVIAEIHAARANYNSATGTYERELQTIAFNVATAYYNALAAQAATNVANQVVKQNEVQLALVQAQLRAGTASRVDVATAQLPVAQARVTLIRAQGTELQNYAALANVMGLDADSLVRPISDKTTTSPTTLLGTEPLSYDNAVKRALLMRPDYLAASYTFQAQQYNLQFQRSGLYPSLTGSASYGTASTTVNGGNFRPSNTEQLTLNIPLYDQGITAAQTELARGQLAQAAAQLQNTKLNVELNVQQALVNFVSSQAAVTEAQAELTQARTVLSSTQAQYRAGVTTLPLLLNAQVGLTTAQTDYLNAVYNLRQAEQSYLYALGDIGTTGPSTL
jgi:outer membrane protein